MRKKQTFLLCSSHYFWYCHNGCRKIVVINGILAKETHTFGRLIRVIGGTQGRFIDAGKARTKAIDDWRQLELLKSEPKRHSIGIVSKDISNYPCG